MKLLQLKYFQTICKYNNITRASNELHVSQPSLSNVIRDLEEEFGVTLFQRLSKGLSLTEEGKILLEHTEKVLSCADVLIEEMTRLGKANQEVKLGIPPMISSIVFPGIMKDLQKQYPLTTLTVTEHGSLTNKSMVADAQLDAALVSGGEPFLACLDMIDICDIPIYFYTSIENPIACRSEISFEDLENVPLVLLKKDTWLTSHVLRRFEKIGIKPTVILYTDQLQTIQRLVDNNTAATFLFDGILNTDENMVSLSFQKTPTAKVRLIWNKNQKHSEGLKNLIHLLKSRS